MSRLSSGFRRFVAFTVSAVALLAFALILNALFTAQSQPTAADARSLIVRQFPEPGDDVMPAWAPDGKRLAYISLLNNESRLFVRDLSTNQTTFIAAPAWAPVWSPDGAQIAHLRVGPDRAGRLYVSSADGTQHAQVSDIQNPGLPLWTPDSRSLIFSAFGSELHLAAYDGSSAQTIPLQGMFRFNATSLSPDGLQVIGNGDTPYGLTGLVSVDWQTVAITSLPVGDIAAGSGRLSPDGSSIAYYTPDPNPSLGSVLRVMRLDTGESRTISNKPGHVIGPYAWSPDSRFIAYSTVADLNPGEIVIAWADGSNSVSLEGIGNNGFAWSPDGAQMAISMQAGDQFDIVIIAADEASLLALQTTPTPSSDPFQVTYVSSESPAYELIWSPEGRRIAFTYGDHSALFVRDLATNEVVPIAENVWHPAWSLDGTRLAYVDNASFDLYVADAKGESRQKVEGARNVRNALWLPVGQSLLYTVGDDAIYAYSVTAQTVDRIPIRGLEWFRGYSLSPDGERVLGIGGAGSEATPGAMYLVDWRTGRASNSWGDTGVQDARLSPDGEYIAFTVDSTPSAIRVVRTGGGEVRVISAPNGAAIGPFAWSPDSRFIAFTTFFPLAAYSEPYVARLDGDQLIPLLTDSSVEALAWSPDGAHLALDVNWDKHQNRGIGLVRADEDSLTARLIALEALPQPSPSITPVGPPTAAPTMTPPGSRDLYQLFRLTTSAEGEYRPAVSPDGQRIAFAGERDGNWDIYVFDWPTFTEIRLTDDPLNDMSPSWSPDGTRIAYQHNVPAADGPVLVERVVMNSDGSNKTVVSSGAVWIGNEAPAWSPDGTRIAFSDGKGVTVVSVADGREMMRFTPPDVSAYFQPAWFDSTHIAFSGDGALLLGDTDTGAVERVPNTAGFAHLPMTTSAFPRIAYFGLPGPAAQLQSILPNGNEPYTLATVSANTIEHAAWSSDGRFIAYQTNGGVHLAVAWTPQYAAAAPLFSIYANVAPSDLLGVSWLPNGSGFVFVGAMDGSPDLYYAALNLEAIQMYLASVPTAGPTPPPPPTAFPIPTQGLPTFGPTPTPFALLPPGTPPYWLQVLYHEGNAAMAVAGQHLWLIDWAGDALVSTDGGTTWGAIKLPEPARAIALSWRYGSDRTIYLAGGSTVYRSTDGGATWPILLVGGDYTSIALGADGSIFVAEESRCAVHRSIDGGTTWTYAQVAPEGCTLAQVALSPAFPQDGIVYALGSSPGLWRSADRGVTWQMIDADVWTDIAVDLTDAGLVYVANAKVVRRIDASGGGRGAEAAVDGIHLVAASPNGSLYAGTLDGRVYESRDQSATWSEISTFFGEPIRDLVALDGVIYVAMERMLVGGYWEGAPVPATPTPAP